MGGTGCLKLSLEALVRLLEVLRRMHNAASHGLDQSLRGGTQTDDQLFQRIDPEIRDLRAAIGPAAGAYVKALPPIDRNHPVRRPRRRLTTLGLAEPKTALLAQFHRSGGAARVRF